MCEGCLAKWGTWYDFDDRHVTPIRVQDLGHQFGGKATADMLMSDPNPNPNPNPNRTRRPTC